jgi:hypothetical protein
MLYFVVRKKTRHLQYNHRFVFFSLWKYLLFDSEKREYARINNILGKMQIDNVTCMSLIRWVLVRMFGFIINWLHAHS